MKLNTQPPCLRPRPEHSLRDFLFGAFTGVLLWVLLTTCSAK